MASRPFRYARDRPLRAMTRLNTSSPPSAVMNRPSTARFVGAVAHHGGVGSPTDEQFDRLDEHGLARPRLAGDHRQPVAEDHLDPFDHAEVLDVQLSQHVVVQLSMRVGGSQDFVSVGVVGVPVAVFVAADPEAEFFQQVVARHSGPPFRGTVHPCAFQLIE